jgi:hypothetical protein
MDSDSVTTTVPELVENYVEINGVAPAPPCPSGHRSYVELQPQRVENSNNEAEFCSDFACFELIHPFTRDAGAARQIRLRQTKLTPSAAYNGANIPNRLYSHLIPLGFKCTMKPFGVNV